jgi:hypothetical protein
MDDNRKQTAVMVFHRYLDALNGPWHRQASLIFLAIVMAHWLEHLLQALQVFVLHWPREISRGALGYVFPWLATSEWLHYVYALVMLVGLLVLRPAYQSQARFWWDTALIIQVWHHFEHALLLGQALAGYNLFGSSVPTSILQLVVPRIELHLFYNAIVFVPMVIAMIYHILSTSNERPACDCSNLAPWVQPLPSVYRDR